MRLKLTLSGGSRNGLQVDLEDGGLATLRIARDLRLHETRPTVPPTFDRYQIERETNGARWLETVTGTLDDWLEFRLVGGPVDGGIVWCAGPLSVVRFRMNPSGPISLYLKSLEQRNTFVYDGVLPPSGGPG